MEVVVRQLEGHAVLGLVGEIDGSNVGVVHEAICRLLLSDPEVLLLDLTHLEYIDSSGLGLIFSIVERLPPSGWLGLMNPGPRTLRLIELVGLLNTPRCRVFLDRAELALALAARSQTEGGPP
jgi:anti-sigma B factor antagonist